MTWAEIVLLIRPCQPGRGKPPRPRASPGGCKSLQRLRSRKAGKGGSGCLLLHLWARVAGPTLLPLLKCCSFVSSAESGLRAPNTELCPALPACSRSKCSDVSRGSGSSSGGKSLGSSFQSPREPGWRGCGRVKERPRGLCGAGGCEAGAQMAQLWQAVGARTVLLLGTGGAGASTRVEGTLGTVQTQPQPQPCRAVAGATGEGPCPWEGTDGALR